MLTRDGSSTVHHYNIQTLATELYNAVMCSYNNIYLKQFLGNCLYTRNNNGYYLRSKSDFVILQIRTVLKELNSGQIIWNLIPEEPKKYNFIEHFQERN